MFTISIAKLVQAESNQACLICRGTAEFRGVIMNHSAKLRPFSYESKSETIQKLSETIQFFTFHSSFITLFCIFAPTNKKL